MEQSNPDDEHGNCLNFPHTNFDIVTIAASAGGLKALSEVLSKLPPNFQSAIIVIQHLARSSHSLMAEILSRRTPLIVKEAQQQDQLKPGYVYIAAPDHHLLVNVDGTLSLTQSKLVNFVRPSADILFDSVATVYKNRAIAVVLTGTGHDASEGIKNIKSMGGIVIIEDPKTAEFKGMPNAAVQTGKVDFIVPLSEIATVLIGLVI